MTFKTAKHSINCHRVSNGSALFGQIKKVDREWHAEIRDTETGTLLRYAGIWNRKSDAVEDCEHIIEREG